jgi:hypothetical protein
MLRIFAVVIGQIMSQLVKKSVRTTDLPFRLPKVKLLPSLSLSGISRTSVGIFSSRIVPPFVAELPLIGGALGIVMASALAKELSKKANVSTAIWGAERAFISLINNTKEL